LIRFKLQKYKKKFWKF